MTTELDIADVASAYETWLHHPQSGKDCFMVFYDRRRKALLRHIASNETLLTGMEPTDDPEVWKPIVEGGMTFNVKRIQDELASLKESLQQIEEMRAKVLTDTSPDERSTS